MFEKSHRVGLGCLRDLITRAPLLLPGDWLDAVMRALGTHHVCPKDERQVRESLGEVPDLAPSAGIVLLCQQPKVISQPEEPIKPTPVDFSAVARPR
jgi:hypothetical protein